MSIRIHYKGRFGNNLFQFAVAMIISEMKNLQINARKVGHFSPLDINKNKEYNDSSELTIGQTNLIDFDAIKKHNGGFYLDGFFQDYRNFVNHKNIIKENYSFEKIHIQNNDESLCIHLRLTDYLDYSFALPNDFVIESINHLNYPILNIVSDSKFDKNIAHIINKINKSIKVNVVEPKNNEWEDFLFIASSKNIFMSMSTYSWWAAFLSDADKIFFPKSPKIYWSNSNHPDAVSLDVTDEDRYIYI
jgi:hypothetical protein